MRRAILALSLLLAACGSSRSQAEEPAVDPEPRRSEPSPVACGDLECGPHERCVIECECCGVSVDPSELRASYRCEPLPAACAEADAPEHDCRRLVEIPCA